MQTTFARLFASAAALSVLAVLAGCGGGGGRGGGGGGGGGGPAPEAKFTIVAAGDVAECGGGVAASGAAKTGALIGASDALVLTLGDTTYPVGAAAEFTDCFHPTWGVHKEKVRPIPGNHEYATPGADGYYSYFGAQAGPDRRGYYSFDYGGWHFIALNSVIDTSLTSDQYQWLKADLGKSSDTLCTLVYWHFPAFSSGTVHGSSTKMTAFFEAIHAAGADVLLTGDEHFYERFAPQNAAGVADPTRGVRQFVVGTGGIGLYGFGTPIPNSEYRDNSTYGILRLTLGQGTYNWQFVPVGGGPPRDVGSGTCHR